MAGAKTATNATNLRSTFKGVAGVFDRIREQKREVRLDDAAIKDLQKLLFEPVIGIEAIRLTRAEAIVSAVKMSPTLAEEMEGAICSLVEKEMSSAVRDRLRAAMKAVPCE